jgi:hypothetical protein
LKTFPTKHANREIGAPGIIARNGRQRIDTFF